MKVDCVDIVDEEKRTLAEVIKRVMSETFLYSCRMRCELDILAVHTNACSLDFNKLLKCQFKDFYHDVSGIRRHLNRHSHPPTLNDNFTPRCAANVAVCVDDIEEEPRTNKKLRMFSTRGEHRDTRMNNVVVKHAVSRKMFTIQVENGFNSSQRIVAQLNYDEAKELHRWLSEKLSGGMA